MSSSGAWPGAPTKHLLLERGQVFSRRRGSPWPQAFRPPVFRANQSSHLTAISASSVAVSAKPRLRVVATANSPGPPNPSPGLPCKDHGLLRAGAQGVLGDLLRHFLGVDELYPADPVLEIIHYLFCKQSNFVTRNSSSKSLWRKISCSWLFCKLLLCFNLVHDGLAQRPHIPALLKVGDVHVPHHILRQVRLRRAKKLVLGDWSSPWA